MGISVPVYNSKALDTFIMYFSTRVAISSFSLPTLRDPVCLHGGTVEPKLSDGTRVAALLISIGVLAYGIYGLVSDDRIHVIYLIMVAIAIVGLVLFERCLPPDS